jgi:hypothetical protein
LAEDAHALVGLLPLTPPQYGDAEQFIDPQKSPLMHVKWICEQPANGADTYVDQHPKLNRLGSKLMLATLCCSYVQQNMLLEHCCQENTWENRVVRLHIIDRSKSTREHAECYAIN